MRLCNTRYVVGLGAGTQQFADDIFNKTQNACQNKQKQQWEKLSTIVRCMPRPTCSQTDYKQYGQFW